MIPTSKNNTKGAQDGEGERKSNKRQTSAHCSASFDEGKEKACVKKLKNRCDASEAIVKIDRVTEDKVIVTMAEGWEHVLPQSIEDDPGCLIMWDYDNLKATVLAFNQAIAAGAISPGWLNVVAGNPLTVPALIAAILGHVQGEAGGGGVVGNAMIAPNSMTQYCQVTQLLCYMLYEYWF